MTTERYERRTIEGVPGYQISAAGTPWKWNRRLPITKDLGGLPTVNIGGIDRLLDEIVCYAFHGPPPYDIRGMTVTHFDGDIWNCAPTNLGWRVDPEWLTKHTLLPLMRPSNLKRRILFYGA